MNCEVVNLLLTFMGCLLQATFIEGMHLIPGKEYFILIGNLCTCINGNDNKNINGRTCVVCGVHLPEISL